MISINSDTGHIGEFWWINSDPSTTHRVAVPFAGARVHLDLFLWGTCGIGRDITVRMEPLNG
jgi:hypothetical protein